MAAETLPNPFSFTSLSLEELCYWDEMIEYMYTQNPEMNLSDPIPAYDGPQMPGMAEAEDALALKEISMAGTTSLFEDELWEMQLEERAMKERQLDRIFGAPKLSTRTLTRADDADVEAVMREIFNQQMLVDDNHDEKEEKEEIESDPNMAAFTQNERAADTLPVSLRGTDIGIDADVCMDDSEALDRALDMFVQEDIRKSMALSALRAHEPMCDAETSTIHEIQSELWAAKREIAALQRCQVDFARELREAKEALTSETRKILAMK
ncbi:hypothetical protein BJX64DRAFT_294768 [Aspergillus heterothallicus]